jgi:hypothetical protein
MSSGQGQPLESARQNLQEPPVPTGILDTALSFGKDAWTFLRSPRVFINQFDAQGKGQGKLSVSYMTFGFILTSAFVLVELRVIPETMTGSSTRSLKKDELIFTYWILILLFVIFLHAGCRLFSGRATFRATLVAILRIYGFLIPGSTLLLIILSQFAASAISTCWLVIPPLQVVGLKPFVPTTGNLLIAAGFVTAYFYLALFFLICTVWALRATHKLSYLRTCLAAATSISALLLVEPLVIGAGRRIYEVFEPLLGPFLGGP